MSSRLIRSLREIVKGLDDDALKVPLNQAVLIALKADPLLNAALFDEGVLDLNAWRALCWAANESPPVQLIWPEEKQKRFPPSVQILPKLRVTKESVLIDPSWNRDSSNRIDDNLIVHGENLGVLHALNADFSKRFKLCYIDPPYGTGSGDFAYRDQYGDAEWLGFMADRIDALKPLLAPEGVVVVQCSFHHQARLESMLKNCFPNHLCTLHLQVRHPGRQLTVDKQFNDVMEHALIFSPHPKRAMPKLRERRELTDYVYSVSTIRVTRRLTLNGREVEVYEPGDYRIEKIEPSATGLKKISIRGTIREKNNSGRIYVRCLEPIAAQLPPMTLLKYPGIGADGLGYRFFYTPDSVGNSGRRRKNGGYFQGVPIGDDHIEKPRPNYMNWEQDYNRVRPEGGVDLRNGKKPERLMAFFIENFTSAGDWVLDYHLGSGTTCAVAHKLGRRYVGIEQMPYAETKAAERLKRVVGTPPFHEVDSGGISQKHGWSGGGEFVFCRAVEIP